jgi:hypothetical protein
MHASGHTKSLQYTAIARKKEPKPHDVHPAPRRVLKATGSPAAASVIALTGFCTSFNLLLLTVLKLSVLLATRLSSALPEPMAVDDSSDECTAGAGAGAGTGRIGGGMCVAGAGADGDTSAGDEKDGPAAVLGGGQAAGGNARTEPGSDGARLLPLPGRAGRDPVWLAAGVVHGAPVPVAAAVPEIDYGEKSSDVGETLRSSGLNRRVCSTLCMFLAWVAV